MLTLVIAQNAFAFMALPYPFSKCSPFAFQKDSF